MSYAELEIAVQCVPDGSYTIDMRFRAEPGDLDRELAINVPLSINKAALLASSTDQQAYGKALAAKFLTEQHLREAWLTARASAEARDLPLRLRLRLDPSDPDLHGIRWETMMDNHGAALARSERLLFSRYLESADMTRFKLPTRAEVTALVAVASPSNLAQFSLAPFDAVAEAARITRALSDIPGATLVSGSSAGAVTLTALIDALRFGYSILYLVCHGNIVDGIPYLALENEQGEVEWVPGGELAERIRDLGSDRRPSLVILASCQSVGVGHDSTTPAALGPQLARAGVAAVIGMQGSVPIAMVAQIMPRFFEQLVEDGQVDRALAVARTGLRPDDPWWLPVLFLRVRDGRLWSDAPAPRPAIAPPPAQRQPVAPARRPTATLWGLGALALLVALVLGLLPIIGRGQQPEAAPAALNLPTAEPTSAPPTPTLAPTVAPTPTPAPPAPFSDGRLMVLLTQIEAPAAGDRDLSDELEQDLRRTLEQVAFSNVGVARYYGVISSDEQARALAAASRAAVVIWGGGRGPSPTLRARVGDTSIFPNIPAELDADLIRRTAELDLKLDLNAPELPSASIAVLSMLNVLTTADGNMYEIFRIAALIDRLAQEVTPLEPLGGGSAVQVLDYFSLYYSKPEEARPVIDAALDDDPSNPFLQAYSAILYQRLGNYEDGQEDAQAAYDVAPTWASPSYMLAFDRLVRGFPEQAVAYLNDVIDARPGDSYPLSIRGAFYYLNGLDDAARFDLEQAIEIGAQTPLPYNYAAALSLRQGRVDEARKLLAAADERFRDQFSFDNRFWRNLFGDDSIFALSIGALAELNAGQNRDAIASATQVLGLESVLMSDRLRSDMYFIIGLAECRRGDPQASLVAYDKGITADPQYGMLYILRAEANQNLGNGLAALADLNAAAESPQGADLAPIIQSAQIGTLTCQNAFEVQ